MGSARNCINVLSSQVVVACPGGMGTLSEIALALKYSKPVILLNYEEEKRFEPSKIKDAFSMPILPRRLLAYSEIISECADF